MVNIKRWYVFAGDNYYPSSAMGDFKRSFDTREEAVEFVMELESRKQYDWVEYEDILDYQR